MALAPFVRIGPGHHPTIDLEALLTFYEDAPLDVWNIASPSDLVSWELLRARHDIADPNGAACDLFVWGAGEAPDPRLTRVGGVPWMPKHVPWPEIDGVVPSFLCQFDFRDSLDIVPDLPGDIMLVFVAEEHTTLEADPDQMRFVWGSAAADDVITTDQVPEPTHPFEHVTAWGVRHRSMDVPSCWDRAFDLPEDGVGGRIYELPVLWGTKIGGVPHHSQDPYREPSGYLCQLVSIQASSETSWPWADRESPLTSFGEAGIHEEPNQLMIGDLGELTFYLQDDGSIVTGAACG